MWVFSSDRLTQQIASVGLFVFIERIIKWLYGENQSEHKICSMWLEFTIQKPERLDWRRVHVRNQIFRSDWLNPYRRPILLWNAWYVSRSGWKETGLFQLTFKPNWEVSRVWWNIFFNFYVSPQLILKKIKRYKLPKFLFVHLLRNSLALDFLDFSSINHLWSR